MLPAGLAERAAANFAQLAAFKDEGERRGIPEILVEIHAEQQWTVLGYATFDAACDAILGGWRLQLPRGERRELVEDLRGRGLSTRAIGSVVGVSKSTVQDDLSGVQNRTPEVLGLDGKTHPATRPPRADLIPDSEPLPPTADEIPDAEAVSLTEQFLSRDADVRAANLRRDFSKWLHAIHQHHLFDPDEMALISAERADDVRASLRSLTTWAERFLAQSSQPLRVIQGSKR